MKSIKLLTTLLAITLFFTACEQTQTETPRTLISKSDTETTALTESDNNYDGDYWAKDNLDLQAVGNLLEKSDSAEDFEYRLNSDNGINNLDLNGDGYVDYISVAEYDDRPDNRRGFSLFNKFDGNDIQEIATLIFDRDRTDRRGARVYLTGNEQIYGSNNFYEGNWLDKGLNIANWIFSDRDDDYRSPYYYDNYPDNYDAYRVVETPVYRDRITQYMVNPAMTKITTPTTKIKIKSPYAGRSYNGIYARLAEPTEEQKIFFENNPKPPKFKEQKNNRKSEKADKADKDFDKSNRAKRDKFEDREDRRENRRADRRNDNPSADRKADKDRKPEKSNKGKNDDSPKKSKKMDHAPKSKNNDKGGGKGGKKKGKN